MSVINLCQFNHHEH